MTTGVIMTITKPASYFINPKSLVCIKDLELILKVSKGTIYRMLRKNLFPKCIKITNGRTRKKLWLYQDIIDFISNVENEKFLLYETQKEKRATKNYECFPNSIQRKAKGIKEW